jgi:hypothetical protein
MIQRMCFGGCGGDILNWIERRLVREMLSNETSSNIRMMLFPPCL